MLISLVVMEMQMVINAGKYSYLCGWTELGILF